MAEKGIAKTQTRGTLVKQDLAEAQTFTTINKQRVNVRDEKNREKKAHTSLPLCSAEGPTTTEGLLIRHFLHRRVTGGWTIFAQQRRKTRHK